MDQSNDRRLWTQAVLIVVALTAVRLIVVWMSDLNLGPDEAQYWAWSKSPALGYFSKPPLIAWLIGGMSTVCGDSEACVRSASPLLYGLGALLIFEAARRFYDARTAFWATIVYITMPGVSFSSALMTTDVPLLTLWAGALVILANLVQRAPAEARLLAAGLGAVIGLAMLAKYAGAYFLLGLAVATVFDQRVRRHLLGLNGLLIFAALLVVFSPNIIWNLQHSFATVSHTVDNASLGGSMFHPNRLAEFAGAQFGVFGPIALGVIVAGLVVGLRRSRWPHVTGNDILLLCISLPVLTAGLTISFLTRANANWAAPTYVGLSIVAAAWMVRGLSLRWLQASTALSLVAAVVLYAAALSPSVVASLGMTNAFKLLRGWEDIGRAVVLTARENAFDAILSDERENTAEFLYYTRQSGIPIHAWLTPDTRVGNHFQIDRAYNGNPPRILYVTDREDRERVLSRFAYAEQIEIISVSLGGGRSRVMRLYDLRDMKPGS